VRLEASDNLHESKGKDYSVDDAEGDYENKKSKALNKVTDSSSSKHLKRPSNSIVLL
jgi:hypothetical protein